MKQSIIIFGLIIGAILSINMVYMVNLCYNNPDFKSNDVVGYTAMIVMFSLIYFGIRNYRDKELAGIISFGKAFKTGILIALVGSTIYVVAWLFYYYLFVPDFIDVFIPHVLKEAAEKGPAELAAKTKEMAEFKEMYKNPLLVVLITYAEVFPIGLVVALISAAILKKKAETVG